VRQVKSKRELDLEGIGLAQRKGAMLAQLAGLAADDRLDPVSLPIIEWFRKEVADAGGAGRLDELTELLPDSGIRRRRWWQGRPAALEAGYGDDDDEEYEDGDDEEGPVPGAGRAGVDYAAELRARRYDLRPHGEGVCDIVQPGWDGSPDPCQRAAGHVIPGGKVCDHHHDALAIPVNRRNP
jgi:hypothetical protein